MIFYAEQREESWFRDAAFDVCVVGAGPAGITLARALARHGWSVGLFEGGGLQPLPASQELYLGDVVGEPYHRLDYVRLRYLGGTSNHWTGYCRPLDAWDFLPHSSNPHSGWPITKADLDQYAAETEEILDLAPPRPPSAFFPAHMSPFTEVFFRFSPPTRFGIKYYDELSQSEKITLCLNANLIEIVLDDHRRSIAALKFRSFRRKQAFAVRARYYVLCLGGIENPRALLNSQGENRYAIGNEYDWVGRCFMDHLHYTLGDILYERDMTEYLYVGPTPELMDRTRTLNFSLRLQKPLMNRKATKIEPSLKSLDTWLGGTIDYGEALGDAPCVLSFNTRLGMVRTIEGCPPLGVLRIASEQALNPESRILLTDKVDAFGLRRIALDWQLSEVDGRTVRLAAMEWAKFMAEKRLGRVRLKEWVLTSDAPLPSLSEDEVVGYHHMCTTRMSADPKQGVVNANCRVHGLENLYLGGSSVFATGGASNPTYTIVQLALRLGDHLNQHLS